MKRFFFYLIMIAAIAGSTCALLFVGGSFIGTVTNYDLIKAFVDALTSGSLSFGTSGVDFYLYLMMVFVLMNAAIILTQILIWLFTGFNLNKLAKFYRISIWYFVSALLFTGGLVYMIIDTSLPIDAIHWTSYLPLGTSIVVMIMGIVFRSIEKSRK